MAGSFLFCDLWFLSSADWLLWRNRWAMNAIDGAKLESCHILGQRWKNFKSATISNLLANGFEEDSELLENK